MINFLDILGRDEASEFSQLEVVELSGVGKRTFRRWRQHFEQDGEAGLWTARSEMRPENGFPPAGKSRPGHFTGPLQRLHGEAFS